VTTFSGERTSPTQCARVACHAPVAVTTLTSVCHPRVFLSIEVAALKRSTGLRRAIADVRKSVSALLRAADSDGLTELPTDQVVLALLPFCVPANRKAIANVVREELVKAIERREEAVALMNQRKVKLNASALAELLALFKVRRAYTCSLARRGSPLSPHGAVWFADACCCRLLCVARWGQIYDADNSGTVSSQEIQAAVAASTALYGKRGSVLMASRLTEDDVHDVVASADQGTLEHREW
jgi:hypothetical protein